MTIYRMDDKKRHHAFAFNINYFILLTYNKQGGNYVGSIKYYVIIKLFST